MHTAGYRDLVDPMVRSVYCEIVRNVTVALDDETYRRARVAAAERGTSLSALVRGYLEQLGTGESELDRLKREERALRERITNFRAGNRYSRDELHERGAS